MEKLTILLESGHDNTIDFGATGFVVEKNINDKLVGYLKQCFEGIAGDRVEVILVPDGAGVNSDLQTTVDFINQYDKNVLCIFIHSNAGGGTGMEVYYYDIYSRKLAESVFGGYIDGIRESFPDFVARGIKMADYYVLRNPYTNCQRVLLETGFVDTLYDANAINNDQAMFITADRMVRRLLKDYGISIDLPVAPKPYEPQIQEVNPDVTEDVAIAGHVQGVGWQPIKYGNELVGSTGQWLRLEAIKGVVSKDLQKLGSLEYMGHLEGIGDTEWVKDFNICGTTGQYRRLEGVAFRLTGKLAELYDVIYRGHLEKTGNTRWYKNGEFMGTRGQYRRLEGIWVILVKK